MSQAEIAETRGGAFARSGIELLHKEADPRRFVLITDNGLSGVGRVADELVASAYDPEMTEDERFDWWIQDPMRRPSPIPGKVTPETKRRLALAAVPIGIGLAFGGAMAAVSSLDRRHDFGSQGSASVCMISALDGLGDNPATMGALKNIVSIDRATGDRSLVKDVVYIKPGNNGVADLDPGTASITQSSVYESSWMVATLAPPMAWGGVATPDGGGNLKYVDHNGVVKARGSCLFPAEIDGALPHIEISKSKGAFVVYRDVSGKVVAEIQVYHKEGDNKAKTLGKLLADRPDLQEKYKEINGTLRGGGGGEGGHGSGSHPRNEKPADTTQDIAVPTTQPVVRDGSKVDSGDDDLPSAETDSPPSVINTIDGGSGDESGDSGGGRGSPHPMQPGKETQVVKQPESKQDSSSGSANSGLGETIEIVQPQSSIIRTGGGDSEKDIGVESSHGSPHPMQPGKETQVVEKPNVKSERTTQPRTSNSSTPKKEESVKPKPRTAQPATVGKNVVTNTSIEESNKLVSPIAGEASSQIEHQALNLETGDVIQITQPLDGAGLSFVNEGGLQWSVILQNEDGTKVLNPGDRATVVGAGLNSEGKQVVIVRCPDGKVRDLGPALDKAQTDVDDGLIYAVDSEGAPALPVTKVENFWEKDDFNINGVISVKRDYPGFEYRDADGNSMTRAFQEGDTLIVTNQYNDHLIVRQLITQTDGSTSLGDKMVVPVKMFFSGANFGVENEALAQVDGSIIKPGDTHTMPEEIVVIYGNSSYKLEKGEEVQIVGMADDVVTIRDEEGNLMVAPRQAIFAGLEKMGVGGEDGAGNQDVDGDGIVDSSEAGDLGGDTAGIENHEDMYVIQPDDTVESIYHKLGDDFIATVGANKVRVDGQLLPGSEIEVVKAFRGESVDLVGNVTISDNFKPEDARYIEGVVEAYQEAFDQLWPELGLYHGLEGTFEDLGPMGIYLIDPNNPDHEGLDARAHFQYPGHPTRPYGIYLSQEAIDLNKEVDGDLGIGHELMHGANYLRDIDGNSVDSPDDIEVMSQQSVAFHAFVVARWLNETESNNGSNMAQH